MFINIDINSDQEYVMVNKCVNRGFNKLVDLVGCRYCGSIFHR